MTIYNHFYIYKEFWVADNRDQTQTLINKDNCKISIVLMAESIYSIQYLNIRVVSRFLKEVKGHLLALIGSRTKSLWGSIWPKKKKERENGPECWQALQFQFYNVQWIDCKLLLWKLNATLNLCFEGPGHMILQLCLCNPITKIRKTQSHHSKIITAFFSST